VLKAVFVSPIGVEMPIAWEKVLPVLVSVIIIIGVAVLREYSRTLAAITATMPINIPLAMWIVYSTTESNPAGRAEFVEGLLLGIAPTVVFLIVVWLVARAGWALVPTLVAGYTVWGISLLIVLFLRRVLA
jgi:hypothetical protein